MKASEPPDRVGPDHRHHPRHSARRKALDILYQADVSGAAPSRVLEDWRELEGGLSPFAEELVRGVEDHLAELDRLIGDHAEGWTVARMAAVDRTIMRLACYELLHRADVPPSVAIAEAVEAAMELSTGDSGRFVNGVLGKIAREQAAGDLPVPGTGDETED